MAEVPSAEAMAALVIENSATPWDKKVLVIGLFRTVSCNLQKFFREL